MKALTAALVLAFWSAALLAADDDASSPVSELRKPGASVARQESLELPGITACHQCEWRPKPHTKAAQDECGSTPDGTAKMGIFECGFSPDCDRVCNFVRCAD